MKTFNLFLFFLLISTGLSAQTGRVLYELYTPPSSPEQVEAWVQKYRKDLAHVPDIAEDMIAKVRQNNPKIFPFELLFEGEKAVWRAIQNLPAGFPGSDSYSFTSSEPHRHLRQDSMGEKYFIVSDSCTNFQWEFTEDTRLIGPFSCKKAIAFKDSTRIEVWFTNEINTHAAPTLPYKLCGTAGLVMEVNLPSGKQLRFKEFSAQLPEGFEVSEPKKGKVVSNEEFIKIRDEWAERMNKQARERFSNPSGIFKD